MGKYIYNEKNGLWYELCGEYYLPCLTLSVEEERPIGVWGKRHLRYIKQERRALYAELLTKGRVNTYCLVSEAGGLPLLSIPYSPSEFILWFII